MAKLLFDESPLCVQPTLAKMIGLEESIVLQQINYWVNISYKQNGDGWVYNTIDQWLEQFPFIGRRSLERVMSRLKDEKLIQVERKKHGSACINYYTIHKQNVEKLEEEATRQIDVLKARPAILAHATRQNDVYQPAKTGVSTYSIDSLSETTHEITKSENKKTIYTLPKHLQILSQGYLAANGNAPSISKGHAIAIGKHWTAMGEEKYTIAAQQWAITKQADGTPHPVGYFAHDPDQYYQKAKAVKPTKKVDMDQVDGNVQGAIKWFSHHVKIGDIDHARDNWDYINKYPTLRDKHNFKEVRP
jgi:hypothetical protein